MIVLSVIPGHAKDDERFFDGLVGNRLASVAARNNCLLEVCKTYGKFGSFYFEIHDSVLGLVSADVWVHFRYNSPQQIITETSYYTRHPHSMPRKAERVENELDVNSPTESLENIIERARVLYLSAALPFSGAGVI